MTNLTGRSLGRYQIYESLGEGGMATVYRAYDTRLGRFVALKVLRPAGEPQPAMLRRFELEARALAQLSHPAIVRVLDYGEENGWPFMVMELVPSGTLKDRLAADARPVPYRDAARFLAPVARALELAHSRGIIHRDVKPSNILIGERGEPLLSDFGIAKTLESDATAELTGTGVRLGTPDYMSPEQCAGAPVDYRTDIYSLGLVLYEMLTHVKPFSADTPMAIMHRQIYDPLPNPRQWAPGLPRAVDEVLGRALAKDPAQRYASMGEFAAALEGLAAGAVSVPAPAPQPRPQREARAADTQPGHVVQRRRRGSNWLGLLLGFLLSLGLVGAALAYGVPRMRAWLDGIGPQPTLDLFPDRTETPATPTPPPVAAAGNWQQGRLIFSQQVNGLATLHILDAGGEWKPRLLYEAPGQHVFGARWSPNGQKIAFYVFPFDLRVMDAVDPGSAFSVGECHSPTWTSDSIRLLCVGRDDGKFRMYDADGGGLRRLEEGGSTPDWSPQGGELLYSRTNGAGGTTIDRLTIENGEHTSLVDEGQMENFAPAWSPDAQQIAFQSNRDSASSEIWVMSRDGQGARRVTSTPGGAWSRGPAWSPDGRWLAFVSSQAGSVGADYGELFVVSLDSGEVIQVTDTGGRVYDWRVSWAP